MWETFKSEMGRIQGQHIPVRMKGKCGRIRESWLTMDIHRKGKISADAEFGGPYFQTFVPSASDGMTGV